MERILLKVESESPNDVKMEPKSLAGAAHSTTPSTVHSPHFLKAWQQLDDSGAQSASETHQSLRRLN
jgi:hypothetical protein